MKPGQEIRGQLDPTIPRPIKNGWVRYVVERPANQMTSFQYKQSLDWDGFAAVAPDGSFVVNNVPEGIFEVIAMCDGYISKQPDMIEDSWHRVALTHPAVSRYGLVYPHPADNPLVLPMEPTGTLQVQVRDQTGQPLQGAEVVQGINQNLHGGSCFLSNGWDSSLDDLKTEMNLPITKSSLPDLLDSRVVTDSQGLATFNNVPEIELYYNVSKKGFNSAEYSKTSVLSGKSTLAGVTLTKVISK